MKKILIIIILAIVAISVQGQVADISDIGDKIQLPVSELANITDEFKNDLMVYGVDRVKASNLTDYFQGKRNYITLQEWNTWIEVVNRAIIENKIKSFGSVKSVDEFIRKCNWLISASVTNYGKQQ